MPDEIAASAALFLARENSSYVKGHARVVNGALSASHPVDNRQYGRTASDGRAASQRLCP